MPIGDDSPFSVADAAFWAAINAVGTRATALRDWRKEQSPGGESEGRNFSSGEIPRLDQLSAKDCPALIVVDRGALSSDDVGADFEGWAYPKAVLGVLWGERRENELSKKVKRFAHLLHAVLVEQRSLAFNSIVDSLGVDPNPIRRVEIGAVEFPQFETQQAVAAFGMTVTFVLDLPVN